MTNATLSERVRAGALRVDENNPDAYWVPLDVAERELAALKDALEWTLDAYKDAIAGRPTPAGDVISHAEKALR